MRSSHFIVPALLATLGLAGTSASAAVTLFDDAQQNGWSVDIGQAETANVYAGTTSLKTGVSWDPNSPQIVLKNNAGGTTIGENKFLDFYVNSSDGSEQGPLTLKINDAEFKYHIGGTYTVDGVNSSGSFKTDTDNSTWQHVRFDLTQPRYYWDSGVQSTSFTETTAITNITMREGTKFLIDNVQMTSDAVAAVPEPATVGLLAVAGLAALRRRRHTA